MFLAEPRGSACNDRLASLKRATWLYLILLVFEGALRKWALPGLSTPLLIIRDPVAIYILFEALRRHVYPHALAFYASFMVGFVALFMAVFVGHGSPYVALFGIRPFLLHFPVMFVMACVLDREDLIRIGKAIVVLSIGMTLLIVIQFYSPQTSFINQGVAGEGSSAGFSGALGYYRPPGTFSFTSGVAQFYSLAAAFLFYFWLKPSGIPRSVLVVGTAALLVALPFSISRTLLFQCGIAVVFAGLAASSRPKLLFRGVMFVLVIVIVLISASPFEGFQTAVDVLQTRFTLASASEGGLEGTLVDRYLGNLFLAFQNGGEWPFWGMGVGIGTNVGAVLMTGEAQFLVAEGEWQRQIGELGLLLGLIVIFLRLSVTLRASLQSVKAMFNGDPLPWLLLSNAITLLPQGGWGQPASLGFSIMSGALLLASLRQRRHSAAMKVSAPSFGGVR